MCVLRNQNNYGVKHWADNCSWSWTGQIYIVVSLKTKFKRHMPGEFHDCSWVFGLGGARVKALGEWKKKEEENEDDETRFSPFPGSSLY